MDAKNEDIFFLIEKRIISLEETKLMAKEMGADSLVAICDHKIQENELLITLIKKL